MIRTVEHKILPFHESHIDIMAIDSADLNYVPMNEIKANLEQYEKFPNSAFTLVIDGAPIVCGGIFLLNTKVAQCWLARSKYAVNYPNIVARVVKRQLFNMAEDFELHRLQTINRDNPLHNEWCEWLGFEREGILRKFTEKGEDAIIYAKVF